MINIEVKIKSKIEEIFHQLSVEQNLGNYGLFGGEAGKCLFYFELYKFTHDDLHYNSFINSLNSIIENISNDNNPIPSFSSGIMGVGWLINYFHKSKIIDENIINEEIYDFAYKSSIEILQWRKAYDYLHGSLGYVLLFGNSSRNNISSLESIIDEILNLSIETEEYCYWIDVLTRDNNPDENYPESFVTFGLSHGMPSILLLLAKADQIIPKFK